MCSPLWADILVESRDLLRSHTQSAIWAPPLAKEHSWRRG